MKFAKIVLVSEREPFSKDLQHFLMSRDVEVSTSHVSDALLQQISEIAPDMLIFDCSGQDVRGLSFCRTLREFYKGLFVVLSAPEYEQFSLLALQLGADLAISTANSLSLIGENIYSLLRRLSSSPVFELHFGDLKIDSRKRDVSVSGRGVNLSTVEFQLLWLLSRKAGQVLSRETLHRELYNTSYNGFDRSIDLYVSRIRHKIGDSASYPTYLKTVRGIGYQFVCEATKKKGTDTNCYRTETFIQ